VIEGIVSDQVFDPTGPQWAAIAVALLMAECILALLFDALFSWVAQRRRSR
jgi:hypothetical protein